MTRTNNTFCPRTRAAIIHANTNHFANPLSDDTADRGVYKNRSGQVIVYPNYGPPSIQGEFIYRPNHGLAHTSRVTAKVRDIVTFYANPLANPEEIPQRLFNALNNEEDIEKISIAATYYVACRESEVRWNANPISAYQRYRLNSSKAFHQYACTLIKEDGTPLFTAKELTLYEKSVLDPYFTKNDRTLLEAGSNNPKTKIASIKAVLSACHGLDLPRCFTSAQMKIKMQELLLPFGNSPNFFSKRGLISNLNKSHVQLILTGNESISLFDEETHTLQDTIIYEKSALFWLASTDPEIAMRLVSLSDFINSITLARKLTRILDYKATQSTDAFLLFLTDVETIGTLKKNKTEKKINALIKSEEASLKKEPPISETPFGRLFKNIQHGGDSTIFKYGWHDFAKSMVNPNHRPELRSQTKPRGKYTSRLHNATYETVSTDKKKRLSLHPNKKEYARHQSFSYSNPQNGYNPTYFSWNNKQELEVGVSFPVTDCIPWRIGRDQNTFERHYDFDSIIASEEFVDYCIKNNLYFTSYAQLENYALSLTSDKAIKELNEVMAGVKWVLNRHFDNSPHITTFSNNLESRLLAQLRAKDLKKRFEKNDHCNVCIPLSFYPDYNAYLPEQQLRDIQAAFNTPLDHYTIATCFIHTHTDCIAPRESIPTLIKTHALLKNVNPDEADSFLKYAAAHLKLNYHSKNIKPDELLRFLKLYDEDQQCELLRSTSKYLLDLCEKTDTFYDFYRSFQDETKDVLFSITKEKIINLSICPKILLTTIHLFNMKHNDIFLDILFERKLIPQNLDFKFALKHAIDNSCYKCQKLISLVNINELKNFITLPFWFNKVFAYSDVKKHVEIFNEMKDCISKFLLLQNNIQHVIQYLNFSQRSESLQLFREYLQKNNCTQGMLKIEFDLMREIIKEATNDFFIAKKEYAKAHFFSGISSADIKYFNEHKRLFNTELPCLSDSIEILKNTLSEIINENNLPENQKIPIRCEYSKLLLQCLEIIKGSPSNTTSPVPIAASHTPHHYANVLCHQ